MCLTRLPEGVNSTIPRNALRKNASGVAMRMKIRQSKTPQLAVVQRHVAFQAYVTALYDRKQEWALCFRDALLVRGNSTNNYCEVAMRVLKDKVLARTKAFNVPQLFDFIVSRMETYYQRRILDVSNNRMGCNPRSRYTAEPAAVQAQDVHKVAGTMYTVPSVAVPGDVHTVDMEIGICTCHVGRTGCLCKHQAVVAQLYKLAASNQVPRYSPQIPAPSALLCGNR